MPQIDAKFAEWDDVFVAPAMSGYAHPRVSFFVMLRRLVRRWQSVAVAGYPDV